MTFENGEVSELVQWAKSLLAKYDPKAKSDSDCSIDEWEIDQDHDTTRELIQKEFPRFETQIMLNDMALSKLDDKLEYF
jgi:hypothetical protein